ncbi:MAG: trimethylamine methyltransferase family protein [Desulfobacteraceae bacterium]|jgi:trimethylamine--corrinoid protein Co-methyltransferase|nr:trimethylamine methyltransferase family protein [Desulfobacteraceae bacterium]
METELTNHCQPKFRILDEAQIERIHQAVLWILDEVGVRVNHPQATDLLAGHGARVMEDNLVQIPSSLVEDAIASAPSNLVMFNRNKTPVMDLGGRRTYFGTGTDLPKTVDLETREIRDTRADDIVTSAIISDALPNIDFIGSYGLPMDVPAGLHYIRCFQMEAENSIKPIFFTAESEEDLAVIWEMACAIAGGPAALSDHPFLISYNEPTSPLAHSKEALGKLMFCAQNRIPVNYAPALLAGSSGPVTLAGALVVAAAEALSGLVIHQLTRKGAPISTGVAATTMDMLEATVSYTSPEFRLTHSACADLFHHYGLPVWGTAGCSDSQYPDLQTGAEYGFTLLNAALDGANLIHDCGYLGQGFVASPELIIFADETIGMVKRYMRGFEIDSAHLALDVIKQVGPGGNFLQEKHTLDFFRQEHWQPGIFNRKNLPNWIKGGRKKADDRLLEKAREILATHQPEPLAPRVKNELDRIWEKARAESQH